MSDESLTWNQIYEAAAAALGVTFKPYYVSSDFLNAVAPAAYELEGNLTGDKSVSVVFDCSKLKTVVPGFKATVRFEEGVRRCVAYILNHPECQQEDPEFDQWADRVIAALEEAKQKI
jgi:nucleoside-diphosphate-sugar epimerase